MKITKLVHSCLLVEMPAPVNRTALFDPGIMSEPMVNVDELQWLDDIIITHKHGDHISVPLVKRLVTKFPEVHITAPQEVVDILAAEGVGASSQPHDDGIVLFDSPHEPVEPFAPQPEEIGVHYLDLLTHPGDSHSFQETKAILALPVQAPWGSTIDALKLGEQLKPRYVIPIHDWHWSDEARQSMYDKLAKAFAEQDITFLSVQNGQPVVVDT